MHFVISNRTLIISNFPLTQYLQPFIKVKLGKVDPVLLSTVNHQQVGARQIVNGYARHDYGLILPVWLIECKVLSVELQSDFCRLV